MAHGATGDAIPLKSKAEHVNGAVNIDDRHIGLAQRMSKAEEARRFRGLASGAVCAWAFSWFVLSVVSLSFAGFTQQKSLNQILIFVSSRIASGIHSSMKR